MRIPNAAWYAAHPSNFTKGRGGNTVKYFTVHHTAANNTTLRYLWGNPDRNGSSHLGVFKGYSEQYVDIDDTAWTNGNWSSNQRSITAEVTGDWRFGYRDQKTLDTLTNVMYECLKLYPGLKLNYHKDVSSSTTLCPADLKDRGYAQECWTTAKNRIELEKRAAEPQGLRVDIPDKKVILIRDANVWDMSFTSFANAKAVARIKEGTVVDVAGVYDHPLSGVDYYLSKWSWDRGINNGISKADVEDYTSPPVIEPKPPEEPPEQDLPETDPETPNGGQGPQEPEVYPSWFRQFIAILIEFLGGLPGIKSSGKENK